jgi:hypothetical protein
MNASEIFKDSYSSVLSRIGLGCVAIATTAASLPLADNLIFDSEKTIAIATLIGAWIGAEISSYKAAPHQHDVDRYFRQKFGREHSRNLCNMVRHNLPVSR